MKWEFSGGRGGGQLRAATLAAPDAGRHLCLLHSGLSLELLLAGHPHRLWLPLLSALPLNLIIRMIPTRPSISVHQHSSLPSLLHPNSARTRLVNYSRRSTFNQVRSVSRDNSAPNIRKANLSARCKERVTIPDRPIGLGRGFSISEFLNHRSGVEALLNTRALQSFEPLDSHTYRCTLHKIQFLRFEVIPVVDLRVTYTNNGCAVEMLSCKFEGSDILKQQNQRFSAFMRNCITWEEDSSEPCLDFDVSLSVTLQIYTKPFTLLPISAVETPGNMVIQGLIDNLVPLLIKQLLEDYQMWITEKATIST